MTKILTQHAAIRQWASARSGNPAMAEFPDGTGSRTILRMVFDQYLVTSGGDSQDDTRQGGLQLVSWEDWLAELDRQKLAVQVDDEAPGLLDSDYELVARPA